MKSMKTTSSQTAGAWALALVLLLPAVASSQTVIDIVSGQTVTGNVEASSSPGQTGRLDDTQYRITIPASYTSITVQLTPQNMSVDLAMLLRIGQAATGSEFDDSIDAGLSGVEQRTYTAGQVTPGQLYIVVVNFDGSPQQFQLVVTIQGGQPTNTPTATPTATQGTGPAIVDIVSGQTVTGNVEASSNPGQTGRLDDTQYRITIPASYTSITVQLTPQNMSVDLAMLLRIGQAATGSEFDDSIDAGLSGVEQRTYTAGQVMPGQLYIVVVNFDGSPQQFQLVVTIQGAAQPTDTPTNTPVATSTPTNTVPAAGAKTWSAGTYQAAAGGSFDLLLTVDNAQGISGGYCQVTFNGGILTAGTAQTQTATTGFRVKSKSETGSVKVAFANATGAGASTNAPLVRIPMTVNAGATQGQTSNLTLVGAALYNQSTSPYTVTPQNGSFQVSGGGGDCAGDADGNGFVNFDDYRSVRDHFGESQPSAGDANHDGFVNFDDYRSVRDHFGEDCN